MKRLLYFFCFFVFLCIGTIWGLEEDQIPQHVSVLPVFFVPKGEVQPTQEQINKVVRHLTIAQQYYRKMLKQRDTFTIADLPPQILQNQMSSAQLKKLEGKYFTQYLLSKLLGHFKINRFNCPYVFLVVNMSPEEPWPIAHGHPLNPGFNSGGGIAVFSSNKLDEKTCLIQGSFLHELGHAFGLVHVNCYGYDQHKNKSIMSYNKENYWSGYNPPKSPGFLLPEEIRGLSMNKRVFPKLFYDSECDIPKGYKIGKFIRIGFDPNIPGQKPYEIKVTTTSDQVNDTNPGNIVLGYICPNRKLKDGVGLVSNQMWMTDKSQSGWIDVELEFPVAVKMNRIRIHSQCGGGLYPVKSIKVEAEIESFREIAEIENISSEEVDVCFDELKSKRWRLYLKSDESGQVVIRGLQFFSSQAEIFCSKIPTYLIQCKNWPIN